MADDKELALLLGGVALVGAGIGYIITTLLQPKPSEHPSLESQYPDVASVAARIQISSGGESLTRKALYAYSAPPNAPRGLFYGYAAPSGSIYAAVKIAYRPIDEATPFYYASITCVGLQTLTITVDGQTYTIASIGEIGQVVPAEIVLKMYSYQV